MLAAHNALAFDSRLLANAMARAKSDLFTVVAGFTDALLAFARTIPN